MEEVIKEYIKNMLIIEVLPEWTPSYEGIILYDKQNHNFVGGDGIGWVIIREEN